LRIDEFLNSQLANRAQVDRTLAAEQRKADFLPKAEGGAALELERPTDAARLATALLRAAARVATANLHGANLSSFLAQVRCTTFFNLSVTNAKH